MLHDLLKDCLSLGPFPELNQPDCPKTKQDKLKELITEDIPQEIQSIINDNNYFVKGRVIQGLWAHVPWIGIHKKNINSSATRGVYIAILFNVLGDGLSLSLVHGTEFFTSIKKLKNRIVDCQINLEVSDLSFKKDPLNKLIPKTGIYKCNNGDVVKYNSGSRPRKYSQSNIVGKSIGEWITVDIVNDLLYLVKLYNYWTTINIPDDNEEFYQKTLNEQIDLRMNEPGKRKEPKDLIPGSFAPIRSIDMGSIALTNANFQCELKNSHKTFETKYGSNFMGKHHLIPMRYYLDHNVNIDHHYNIYSLCPNCRSKIIFGNKTDRENTISYLYNLRKNIYSNVYGVSLKKVKRYYL